MKEFLIEIIQEHRNSISAFFGWSFISIVNLISAFATPRKFVKSAVSQPNEYFVPDYCLTELHLIHTIINYHLRVVHPSKSGSTIRQHRQSKDSHARQVAFEMALCFSTFRIYMYHPLMIQRSISKQIDTFLRKFHIIGNPNLLTYQLFKIILRVDNYFSIILFLYLYSFYR